MVKDRWLKVALFSLIAVLVLGLTQAVITPAISPGTQRFGFGMGQGMMGSGMGIAQKMNGMMGIGGMSQSSWLGSLSGLILMVLTISLFVGLIGFVYNYFKNETKAVNSLVASQTQSVETVVENETQADKTVVESEVKVEKVVVQTETKAENVAAEGEFKAENPVVEGDSSKGQKRK
ncbi:hypothetical protein [Effusibacillus consociatus]|uniref:Uncharacterized protein n=1 Tax=Effusibacillus consociatus TaxID=1117041 RepID=A0ABV9Q0A3_9BACL